VLLEGEAGTGKELVAEAIHELGGSKGPFVVFDCTMISPPRIESDLFGHDGCRGLFEEANGGTLVIAEIGDLPLPLQAELLRVIDRGEVRRAGSDVAIAVDVRVIATTRCDLDLAVAAGRFRDDLHRRLSAARVEVPPLRHRHGDVSLLARHFAKECGTDELPIDILQRFEDHAWPGNVRELHNAVSRYMVLGESEIERDAFKKTIACRDSTTVEVPVARRAREDDDTGSRRSFRARSLR
jgi:DNA-binding NtrC family response regulator